MAAAVITGTAAFLQSGGAAAADLPRPEYPRPQFERSEWINLNGQWSYTFDFSRSGMDRELFRSEGFDGQITVPFAPQSELSGVGFTDFIPEMWYQRRLEIPADWDGKRILLHFGAHPSTLTAGSQGDTGEAHPPLPSTSHGWSVQERPTIW